MDFKNFKLVPEKYYYQCVALGCCIMRRHAM